MEKNISSTLNAEDYRLPFDHFAEGIQIAQMIFNDLGQPADCLILDVNSAYEKHSGLKREQVAGKRVTDIIPVVEPEWLEKYGEAVKTQKPVRFQICGVSLKRWFDISVYPLGRENKLQIILSDITEKKRNEEALRQSENKFRALSDTSPALIWHNGANGENIYVNQHFLDFAGLNATNIQGTGWHTLVHPEDRDAYVADYIEAVHGKRAWSNHYRIRRFDGEWRWFDNHAQPLFDANGDYIGHVGVSVDITERKKTDEALKASEEMLRTVLGMSLDGISRFNYKTGLFDYLSPSATSIVGYSVEELLYLDKAAMHAMIHPDDLHGMLAEIERLEKTGEATAEYRQIHKNGTYVWMSNHMSIVRDDEGSPIYRYGSLRNITESKHAEEAVKKVNAELAKRTREVQDERQRFYGVLETLPAMICLITPDYHIPFANKAFREKFGEAEGRYCYDYCHGYTEPCAFCEALMPLITGRPHQWELTLPDGSTIIDAYDFPFTDIDGTTLILEMDIDITERKRIEDQLKLQANLLSSVHDGIIAVDENMTITYWNESAEKISGWTASEATGQSGKEIFANMGVDRLYEEMTAELNSLGFYYKEVWAYRKDGELMYADLHMKRIFDKNGKFRGTITTFRDITERKKAEERINQQNSILQAINGVYEKSVTCTTHQKLGKECLKIIHSLLGNGAGLIAEVGDERVLHDIAFDLGQESPGLPEGMAKHSRMNGAGIVGLYRSVIENAQTVLTNDPSSHPDSTGIPQRHFKIKSFLGVPFIRERKVLGLIGVANKEGGFNEKDRVLLEAITPSILEVLMLKKTEEELQKSERQALGLVKELEIADKNKDQFIGVLSHELRNPLAVISAGVQLLDVTQDKGQTTMVKEIINRQTNQLCKLVDDLLELTRLSHNKIKLKKENINLNDIVKSAVEDTRLEYDKKGVRIETQIQANPVLLEADPVRITQAVGNILINALKFTQASGTVRIMLQMDKDCAVISVNDNGIGISPEILPHLFTPFTQADNTLERSGGGLGLGLSIVKGIVDLHEGSVNAYSDGLGKGSTFTIRLPIMPGENLGKERIVTGNIKKLKLLIIEDNKDFADLMCTMLSTAGYEACIAYDGIEGIKLAKQNKPDIIFCDIGLPGINGYDVAKIVKADETLKNSFLVALTGYARDEDVKLAIESGFDKHLTKPVDIKLLTQIINESGSRNTRDSSLC